MSETSNPTGNPRLFAVTLTKTIVVVAEDEYGAIMQADDAISFCGDVDYDNEDFAVSPEPFRAPAGWSRASIPFGELNLGDKTLGEWLDEAEAEGDN